jgi:TolA-binding protein
VNSLTSPVQVRASAISLGFGETPPASRTPPLPYFLMEDGSAAQSPDQGLPPPRPISPETAKAIEVILAKAPQVKPAMPAASTLPEELAAPAGGEDYALSIIVSGKIAQKDWAGAIDQLRKYLSLNRGPKASARAHFYLGEALAFSGSGRDSFFEFLSARDFYPLQTKPWIDYVLSTLNNG